MSFSAFGHRGARHESRQKSLVVVAYPVHCRHAGARVGQISVGIGRAGSSVPRLQMPQGVQNRAPECLSIVIVGTGGSRQQLRTLHARVDRAGGFKVCC